MVNAADLSVSTVPPRESDAGKPLPCVFVIAGMNTLDLADVCEHRPARFGVV